MLLIKRLCAKIAIGMFLIFLIDCKPSDQTLPEVDKDVVRGKIILPGGSDAEINKLVVSTLVSKSPVVNGEFTVVLPKDDFSMQFVARDTTVVMIGMRYPGQTNYDISSTSTALALLLNSPACLSLSSAGRNKAMQDALKSASFKKLVDVIEQTIKKNKGLFNGSSVEIAQALDPVLSAISGRISAATVPPVIIQKNDRDLTFINNARTHRTVIGIYKDGVRQKIGNENFFLIDEVKFIPESLNELIEGSKGIELKEYNYRMDLDGKYEIRIRTGKPGSSFVESPEARKALNQNVLLGVLQVTAVILGEGAADLSCYTKFASYASGLLDASIEGYEHSVSGTASMILTASAAVLSDIGEVATCFGDPEHLANVDFIKKGARFLAFVNQISRLGTIGNTLVFSNHWDHSISSVDECINVKGGKVLACDAPEPVDELFKKKAFWTQGFPESTVFTVNRGQMVETEFTKGQTPLTNFHKITLFLPLGDTELRTNLDGAFFQPYGENVYLTQGGTVDSRDDNFCLVTYSYVFNPPQLKCLGAGVLRKDKPLVIRVSK